MAQEIVFCCFQSLLGKKLGKKVTGARARQLVRTKSDYLYAIFWLYTRPSFETWFSDKFVVLPPPELVD